MNKSLIKFILQSVTAGLAIGFLVVFFKPEILNKNSRQNNVPLGQSPSSYANAVNKITPSVVSIYARSQRTVNNNRLSAEAQRFLGQSLVPQSVVTQQYLGSGVVMSDDGYIVTNYHVIQNATQVIVSLWDNTLLEAKLIGSDSVTDLAVLKIEAIDLKPATFANSDLTQTGDIVMAVGNPYGLSQSVTLGIISAKGRRGLDLSTIENFIQTDAAINEGNSGGALIDANGSVVGISTANFNQDGAQGINFAIPSNATKLIMQEILDNGKVSRGWLGIEPYTEQLHYLSRTMMPRNGVMVYNLFENFPAFKAGFKPKDIIISINDVKVKNLRHYLEIIAKSKPGENLEIYGYTQQGQEYTRQVTTVDRPIQLR